MFQILIKYPDIVDSAEAEAEVGGGGGNGDPWMFAPAAPASEPDFFGGLSWFGIERSDH